MLLPLIKKISEYSDEQFKNLNDGEKYVVSLDYLLQKKLKAICGSTSDVYDAVLRTLKSPDGFNNTLEQLKELSSPFLNKSLSNQNDYHPLILAAHTGNVQYFEMASANQAVWNSKYLTRIINTAQNMTGWSVDQYIRDKMVELCIINNNKYNCLETPKNQYNYLETPKNQSLPNDYSPEARNNPELKDKSQFELMFAAVTNHRGEEIHPTRKLELNDFIKKAQEVEKILNENINKGNFLISQLQAFQTDNSENSDTTNLLAVTNNQTDEV